jgi:hypothetical protein
MKTLIENLKRDYLPMADLDTRDEYLRKEAIIDAAIWMMKGVIIGAVMVGFMCFVMA